MHEWAKKGRGALMVFVLALAVSAGMAHAKDKTDAPPKESAARAEQADDSLRKEIRSLKREIAEIRNSSQPERNEVLATGNVKEAVSTLRMALVAMSIGLVMSLFEVRRMKRQLKELKDNS